jgi:MFS superfamily sulfate permease-like transporter
MSALLVPLIGSIPTVVNAGILIYIGTIFMPWERLDRLRRLPGGVIHVAIALLAGLVSLGTFGIDKGLFVAFALGRAMLLYEKGIKQDVTSAYLFARPRYC